jgi:hypothetical protein
VPDAARQLQAIYLAGYEIQTFERFPNAVGVIKGHCIALLQMAPAGLSLIGQPGWRMGEVLGVLVELGDQRFFQAKNELIEATPERLSELATFREELEVLLSPNA